MNIEDECNWKEDFKMENGNYLNKCIQCIKFFIGHKRRIVCKKCDTELRQGGIL